MKRFLAVSLCLFAVTLSSFAKSPKPASKKSAAGPAPDKVLMQEMGNLRWTVVFENQDGKWLIVHEHVSAPLQ
jgi:SnoaL-like domain